ACRRRDLPAEGGRREGRAGLPPRRCRGAAVSPRQLRRGVLLFHARARRERARRRARDAAGRPPRRSRLHPCSQRAGVLRGALQALLGAAHAEVARPLVSPGARAPHGLREHADPARAAPARGARARGGRAAGDEARRGRGAPARDGEPALAARARVLPALRHRAPHRAAGPPVTGLALRMDDVGAASKRHEVYGITRLEVGGLRVPFPGNLLFLKYLPPIKRWGPYRQREGGDWEGVLAWLERHAPRLTVGVTAGWVEDDGSITPYPRKFPEASRVVRLGAERGLLEVANHGYTHCVL